MAFSWKVTGKSVAISIAPTVVLRGQPLPVQAMRGADYVRLVLMIAVLSLSAINTIVSFFHLAYLNTEPYFILLSCKNSTKPCITEYHVNRVLLTPSLGTRPPVSYL